MEKLYFIMEQSLNAQLLDATVLLVLNLLDADDQILAAFAQNERVVDAVCSAVTTRLQLAKSDQHLINAKFTISKFVYIYTP